MIRAEVVQFFFRHRLCECYSIIDCSAYPGFIFIILLDDALITDFGQEVTVETDFVKRFPRKDDYPDLIALRQSLLDGLSDNAEFRSARQKMQFLMAKKQINSNEGAI